jgi:hypothetical protein
MANYVKEAKMWSGAGYIVIPVSSLKNPNLKEWTSISKPFSGEECERLFSNCWGMGLVCGTDKKITAVDVDSKHSLTSDFFESFVAAIPKTILNKCYHQSTMSGGAHLVFSCNKVGRNEKLANRLTTSYEKHETYLSAFKDVKTRENALNIALNDKVKVLVETRGEGGFIVVAPSPGYKHISGKIKELTEKEYDELMTICRSFNEYFEPHKDYKKDKIIRENNTNPFEKYNNEADILDLLLNYGWEVVGQSNSSVRLKRYGNPTSKSSALLDLNTKVFNVFTTSTIFEANKGYSPASVFTMLECNNDTMLAYRKLTELGY